jgi:hypothetical protein
MQQSKWDGGDQNFGRLRQFSSWSERMIYSFFPTKELGRGACFDVLTILIATLNCLPRVSSRYLNLNYITLPFNLVFLPIWDSLCVQDTECELKCGRLRALNSNKVSFSIYREIFPFLGR